MKCNRSEQAIYARSPLNSLILHRRWDERCILARQSLCAGAQSWIILSVDVEGQLEWIRNH